MKRFLLLALLVFPFACAFAQNISVADFKLRETDMTATSLEGRRKDQNGEWAALIRIETTETGFVFEAGALGVVDTKQETGEVWVWVPRASRKITIKHPKLGVLYDYRYPIEIEAERTYWMKLVTGRVVTTIEEEVRQQYLAFKVTPPNATLEVNDDIWEVDADGNAQDYVNFGTYSWRVQAPNYHADAGNVTVNDPNNTQFVTVTLLPNFGWIEVDGKGSLQGASVYIDNAMAGKVPFKSEALKSGPHSVRIVKKMYVTYSETVTVSDNQTTHLSPALTSDFAEVTLKVDADAEIWVNNEKKSVRTWTGPLGSGTYKIECKQAGHETSLTTKEITAAMNGQTIILTPPTPIYGALMVESAPKFCKLYIDGKDMGTTPKSINEILVGQHEIRLTQEGYTDYRETVTVAKGERKQVKATLQAASKPVAEPPQPLNNNDNESVNLSGSGTYKGHEYVDLGLPSGTLWATCNVGASKPEEYGNYYAWGETTTKRNYFPENYNLVSLVKYEGNDGLTSLQLTDDAANANWGSGWCVPTKEQWEELKNNTTMIWTTQNGVSGSVFKASNGNSLFLPAAGVRSGTIHESAGECGFYWSSSLDPDKPYNAWLLGFDSDNIHLFYGGICEGTTVRPVRSTQN